VSDGDLDPRALAEPPSRCRPGGGIDTDSTPLSRTDRAYMSLRASRPPYSHVVVGVALDGVGGRLPFAGATVLQSADENVDLAVGVQREERVGAGEPEIQPVVVLRGRRSGVPVRVGIGEPVVVARGSYGTCSAI